MALTGYCCSTRGLGLPSEYTWVRWSSYADDTSSASDATSGMYNYQWYSWNNISTTTSAEYAATNNNGWARVVPLPEPAPARRLVNPEEERRHRQAVRVLERQREEAAKAAEALLMENLTPEQRKMVAESKRFHVIGSDGRRYEVDTTKRWHNVFLLDGDGKRVEEHCIYQQGGTPMSDNHLAQKLLLEADVSEFRRIANMRRLG